MKKIAVFIDVQNDFIDGVLGSPWAQKVTPDIIKFAKECREKGYDLYATADTHGANYMETLEGKNLPVPHCIEGTEGHKIVNGLVRDIEDGSVIIPQENIVDKPIFGSYALINLLGERYAERDIDEIVLCGFCTSICVISNAIMLRSRFTNTPVKIMTDLCADVTNEMHKAAILTANSNMIQTLRWNDMVSCDAPNDIIHVEAGVRYAEDADVNENEEKDDAPTMPFLERKDDEWLWKLDIDAKTGEVIGWKEKYPDIKTAESYYKVCDCCHIVYGDIDYDEYVPEFLSLDECGYGDYMYITIENGFIKGWNERLFREFVNKVANRD